MMKGIRLLLVLAGLMLALSLGMAQAEGTAALPPSAKALLEQVYPNQQITMTSGSGDDEQGIFAVVLPYGEEELDQYIVTVLEKSKDDEAYRQSGTSLPMWQAPLAVSVTAKELALTCSASLGEQDIKDYLFTKSMAGKWTLAEGRYVDMQTVEPKITGSYQLTVHDYFLEYARTDEGMQIQYPHLLYGEGFQSSLELECFDGRFALTPWDFSNGDYSQVINTPLAEEGETLKQLALLQKEIVLIVKLSDGTYQIKIYPWDNDTQTYDEPQKTKPSVAKLSLDTFHAGDNELQLNKGDGCYGFDRMKDGKWYLSWIQDDILVDLGINYAVDYSNPTIRPGDKDGHFYGTHPFTDIQLMDLDHMPQTVDDVMSQIDTSNYAYVNNPNPEDRLNIRKGPKSDAATLGKLYNRTPLYVKEILGDWVHVWVGTADGLDGYVMKKFLAMGEGKEQVKGAFPRLSLTEDAQNQPIYAEPSEKADILTRTGSMAYDIVGVYGDEWFIIMMDDGTVGYAPQASYWAGNG
ncbi:MAG: SH3 domain-containing protein [Clostridiales bacterium]|nr:SH3 domain-containing protein [Clostridiales bacterium]